MQPSAFTVKWNDSEAAGFTDVLPQSMFAVDGEVAGVTHKVRGPTKAENTEAQCDVRVEGTQADLDYSPYALFNDERDVMLGLMRIVFVDQTRQSIKQVLWRDDRAKDFAEISPAPTVAVEGEAVNHVSMVVPRFTFNVGQKYTRRDLRAAFGLDPNTTGGKVDTGYFEQGGAFFILCGVGTAGRTGHDYGNRLENGFLVWYGRTGARLAHKLTKRMIAPGAEVHVFHRNDDRHPFTYAGRGTPAATKDVVPVEITWKLESGKSLLREGADLEERDSDTHVPERVPDDSISAAAYFVPPPTPSPAKKNSTAGSAAKTNHAARDAKNRNLGRAGERFVVHLERKRLREQGRPDLAAKVDWVADTQGDGLGYDVRSFNPQTGNPLLIEVKTTNGAANTPFFVTRREIEASATNAKSYRLYRVFGYRTSPQVFVIDGSLKTRCSLTAKVYEARCK